MDGYIADGYGKQGHHCPDDADWYAKAGIGNNTWSFAAASGRSLGHLGEADAGKALEEFRKLPESDRRPAVKAEPDPDKGIAMLRPPRGGLVARAYGTALERSAAGELGRAARLYTDCYATSAGCVEPALTQIDMLWMTEPEARSLVPADPVVGTRQRIPQVIERRMIAHTIPKCGPIGDSGELSLVVTDVAGSTVGLRLEGFSRKGHTFDQFKEGFAKKAQDKSSGRDYEGGVVRFLGFLKYDVKKHAFTTFDVVAVGEAWGEYVNRAHGSGAGSEPRRWPVGFAYELAGPGAADRITPPAIVQNALYNGGLAEAYWGN
jgi:hypothetical protein